MKILDQKTGAIIISFAILIAPTVVFGASLIPCGQPAGTASITVGGAPHETTNPCGFDDLIILANTVISFLMYDVAVPLAALGFMWAGGNLVLNQHKESAWSDAKSRFGDIGMGFLIMLGAFILIKFILLQFLSTDQATFVNFLIE